MRSSIANPGFDLEGRALLARIQAYQEDSLGAKYRRDARQSEERIAQDLRQFAIQCTDQAAGDLEERLRADLARAAFPEGFATLTGAYGVAPGSAAARARKALAPLLPILYLTAFSWGAYIVCEAAKVYGPQVAAAAVQGMKGAR